MAVTLPEPRSRHKRDVPTRAHILAKLEELAESVKSQKRKPTSDEKKNAIKQFIKTLGNVSQADEELILDDLESYPL